MIYTDKILRNTKISNLVVEVSKPNKTRLQDVKTIKEWYIFQLGESEGEIFNKYPYMINFRT